MPGGRWLPAKRVWQYPQTFFTAMRVEQVFGKTSDWVDYSDKFMNYLKFAELSQRPEVSYERIRECAEDELTATPITKADPWLHQLQAYNFALPREAVMLDMDMGTGKTKVVFDLILNRRHRTTLVIAPPKILESQVWEEQAIKHWAQEKGTLRMLNLYRDDMTVAQRTMLAAGWLDPQGALTFDIVLINYESVWRSPFKEWAKAQDWDLVVLEESHRAKKAGGKASFAINDIGRRAKYRIAMSGTPMAHSPLDIYAQYRFLDCGIFGTNASSFNNRYAVYGGFQNREVVDFQNQAELQRKYFQIAFHVDESVQSLPPTQDLFRYVQLSPKLKKKYNAMRKDMVTTFKGKLATAGNALTRTLRLQQIAGGHVTLDPEDDEAKGKVEIVGTEKRDMLLDILMDLDPNEPVVVFTKFKPDMDAVRWACHQAGAPFAEVSGRINEVKRWKRGKAQVLGAQIKSGSEGLDLTRARYAIYFSLTHSLSDYKQSRKRVHRPGQTRPTSFIHIVALGTIDREIMTALEKRQDVIRYLMKIGYFTEQEV